MWCPSPGDRLVSVQWSVLKSHPPHFSSIQPRLNRTVQKIRMERSLTVKNDDTLREKPGLKSRRPHVVDLITGIAFDQGLRARGIMDLMRTREHLQLLLPQLFPGLSWTP